MESYDSYAKMKNYMEYYNFKMKSYNEVANDRIVQFYNNVKNDLPYGCHFEQYNGGWYVKLNLPNIRANSNIKSISISAINIMYSTNYNSQVLETTLMGETDNIIYDTALGYSDVLSHSDDFAVLEEIKRLVSA